jgi:hypothetical protein
MVDYDFEIMGLASTMAKPMGLWEADCSDPNFQAEGDSAIEVGSHTITVVIQALGPFPPADSSGASQVECKTILAGVGGLGEVGIQWSTIGPAWLSFDSHFSISEPAAS